MMRLSDKEIRFIDSRYNELFRIPDGGKIEITSKDGSKKIMTCKYIDNYHLYLDNNCFHICQFAEIMERNGSTYRPLDALSYTLEKIEQSEFDFTFAPEDKTENRGCICYIRGYFDNSVYERLQTSAMVENKDNYNKYRTQEFSRECDNVINYFRFQSDTPILQSRTKMQNIAYDIGAERYENDKEISGYRVTTDKNVYYFKCDARRGQYNLYCYAYDKAQLERYKNIRFVSKNYGEVERDKFFKTDSGFTEVYYNPDASAGSQLVYTRVRKAVVAGQTNGHGYGILSAITQNAILDTRDMYLRADVYAQAEEYLKILLADVIIKVENGMDTDTAVKAAYERIYQSVNPTFNHDEQFALDSCYRDIPPVDMAMFHTARKIINDARAVYVENNNR